MQMSHHRWVQLFDKACSMNFDAAHAIVSTAKILRMQVMNLETPQYLYAFPVSGFFTLPSEGLSRFWQLFSSAVFDRDLVTRDSEHPLSFYDDSDDGFELTISDEWGDAWFLTVGPSQDRSRNNTPLRRRSSLALAPYL